MRCSLRDCPSATPAKLDERYFADRALAGMTMTQQTKVVGAPNFSFASRSSVLIFANGGHGLRPWASTSECVRARKVFLEQGIARFTNS